MFIMFDGSTVLATVLAAVAEARGYETSGNSSTFDSVNASFEGVNVIVVSSAAASGSSLGPSDTTCSSIGGGSPSMEIVSSAASVGVASSAFAAGIDADAFFGAGGGLANSPAQPPTLLLLAAMASALLSVVGGAGVSAVVSLPHPPAAGDSVVPFVGVSPVVAAGAVALSPQLSSTVFAAAFVPLLCAPAFAPRVPRPRSAPRLRPRLSPAPRPRPPRVPLAASPEVGSLAFGFFFPTSPH